MGELPQDWEKSTIGKRATVSNGSTPNRGVARYWENGTFPWLPTTKVNDRIITNADEFISQAAMDECSVRIFPAKSVLVGMIGQGKTRGKVAYLTIDAAINQNFASISTDSSLDSRFLFHFLEASYWKLRESSHGSNQSALNCKLIADFPILVPPIEEQRKIAGILSTWDEAIRLAQALIAGKQQRKKGLMQRLLTGQVRFPGFAEQPWRKAELGEFFREFSRKNIDSEDLTVLSCSKVHGIVPQTVIFDSNYTGVRSGMRISPEKTDPKASHTLTPCLRMVEI